MSTCRYSHSIWIGTWSVPKFSTVIIIAPLHLCSLIPRLRRILYDINFDRFPCRNQVRRDKRKIYILKATYNLHTVLIFFLSILDYTGPCLGIQMERLVVSWPWVEWTLAITLEISPICQWHSRAIGNSIWTKSTSPILVCVSGVVRLSLTPALRWLQGRRMRSNWFKEPLVRSHSWTDRYI